MRNYDAFEGQVLDAGCWRFPTFEGPDGRTYVTREPDALITVADGTLGVRVAPFTVASDASMPTLDNPKHVMLSTAAFPVARDRPTRFSVEMAADSLGGDPFDYRDGFAGFIVVDEERYTIYDHLTTGRRVHVIHENLHIPGQPASAPADESFSYVIDAPVACVATEPGQFHEFLTEIDVREDRVRWFVDGAKVYEARGMRAPATEVRIGFGLFTLHPLQGGRSVSNKGQGMAGWWRRFRTTSEPRVG